MVVPDYSAAVTQQHPMDTRPQYQALMAPSPAPSMRRPREIIIPPPQINALVSEIHQALTTKQRLSVLSRIEDLLRQDATLAPWLVEAGSIWDALVLQLRFAIRRQGTSSSEVQEMCHVLNVILQASRPDIQQKLLLDQDILELLLQACQRSETTLNLSVFSMWYLASSTEAGTRKMMESRQIFALIRDVFRQALSCSSSASQMPTKLCLGYALGIIKNTTHFVHSSWDYIGEIPGFLSGLLDVSSLITNQQEPKDRERLSAIWRNLAAVQDIRSQLVQDSRVLNALHSLATNHSVHDVAAINTLRNVLNTIITLSIDGDSCLVLLMHGDGLFYRLMSALLTSHDDTIRRRAARTIRLWASHESSGAMLVHCPNLMERVATVAVQDSCIEVRQEAAEAFGRCAGWVQSPMPQQVTILEALSCLCQSTRNPSVVARALKGQAAHPNNRSLLIEKPIFLKTLVSIALNEFGTCSSLAKEDACCALAHLAAEQKSRIQMACTPKLLQALCSNISTPSRREYAVQALVYLAQEEENMSKMARFPSLLPSLIRHTSRSESSSKGAVKQTILLLVTEM